MALRAHLRVRASRGVAHGGGGAGSARGLERSARGRLRAG